MSISLGIELGGPWFPVAPVTAMSRGIFYCSWPVWGSGAG